MEHSSGERCGGLSGSATHHEHQDSVDIRVQHHRPAGRLQVTASALLPLPPATAFALLKHPANEQIFRHLERCTHHAVLYDSGSGHVVVESEHIAMWRLLGLSGKLSTRLRVQQDHRSLQSRFQLVPGRFDLLRQFCGSWTVQPQPAELCAHLRRAGSSGGGDSCCLVSLEQELEPAVHLPVLGGLLGRLACQQLFGIFADLQQEAAKINSGRATLWPGDKARRP